MSDTPEEVTKPEPPAPPEPDPIAAVHTRIDGLASKLEQLGEFVGHLVERIEEKIARAARPFVGAAAQAVEAIAPPTSPVAKVAELAGALGDWTCPDHPDAPAPDNRCTAEGCDKRAPTP